ncbi:MAG TPA: endonuclease/exonuclease/phosphatase family protein [Planctomycetota bacterium]|nr:endonuclease/exonuclease/phosphatase family protein [Planctomycetota bacterium]
MSGRRRQILRVAGWAAAVLGAALVLARVSVRDRLPGFSILFYAAPPLVPSVLFGFAGSAGLALGQRRLARGAAVAALACLAWLLAGHLACRPQADAPLRVLVWNSGRGIRGWDGIAALLAREKPDLVLLGEAGKNDVGVVRAALPAHDWRWPGGGLAAAVRGRILEATSFTIGPGSAASVLRVEIDGRRLTVLLADLWADPFYDRAEVFARLNVMRRGADLVAGDFNTPGGSVHFDAWRRDLVHAFDAAGRGWDATWPWPLPLLAIDHLWCGPRVTPRRCRLVASPASDHRAVVADVELRPD